MGVLRNAVSVCVGLCVIGTTFSAQAETRAHSITATIGGGRYYFPEKRKLSDAALPIVAVGYNFTPNWAVEGLFGFFNSQTHNEIDNNKVASANLFLFDVLYKFNAIHHVEPYVLAGVGILGMDPNGNDAHNEGNVNIGAGLAFFFDKSLALRVEARDIETIVGGKNDHMFDAGFTYLFDL